MVFVVATSGPTLSFLSPFFPPFFRPRDDALSVDPRLLPLSALAAVALCDVDSHADSGISDSGEGPSSLASVEVEEPPKSTEAGLATPFTWLLACGAGDLTLDIEEASTAVEAELVDVSLMSSSMLSAHLAPLSSDFNAGMLPCSFAGVMAPDGDLLDCVEAGFDAPRAACAYEKGIAGAAASAASACADDIVQKVGIGVCALSGELESVVTDRGF